MTYIHIANFRVRHYECNAQGRVYPAVLLGYMQESAFDASAAVGYSAARYGEIGLQWLAYETEIHYLRPLHYGENVELRTWVADFRRVRSLRRYELYAEGELVMHAATDWVLIDTNALYPATIPPEIIAAYSQGQPIDEAERLTAPPRPPFPRFPEIPEDAATVQRRVEWRDLDPAGHVNNAVYLHYIAEAERVTAQRAPSYPRHLQIEYKTAALLDDAITVTTWGEDDTRLFVLTRTGDGKLLARVRAGY